MKLAKGGIFWRAEDATFPTRVASRRCSLRASAPWKWVIARRLRHEAPAGAGHEMCVYDGAGMRSHGFRLPRGAATSSRLSREGAQAAGRRAPPFSWSRDTVRSPRPPCGSRRSARGRTGPAVRAPARPDIAPFHRTGRRRCDPLRSATTPRRNGQTAPTGT